MAFSKILFLKLLLAFRPLHHIEDALLLENEMASSLLIGSTRSNTSTQIHGTCILQIIVARVL